MDLGVKQNAIERWFDIPWVRGLIYNGFGGQSKYHRQMVRYTMGKGLYIPWV
jgi:hypothetical protein